MRYFRCLEILPTPLSACDAWLVHTGEGQTLLTHTELCEGPYILGTCLDTDTCELEVEDEVVITDVGVVIILVLARAVGCTKGYLRVKAEVLLAQPVELDGWQYVPKTSRRYHI